MAIQVLRETKEAPADIQARIARVGGTELLSGRPNFRLVWGRNILAGHPDGNWPFADPDRWYLQRLVPPRYGGDPLGDYELCDDYGILGRRLPSTGTLEHFVIPLIERSKGLNFKERRAAIQAREERLELRREKRDRDILDDAGPAFHGAAASGPAGPVKSYLEKTEGKWKRRSATADGG